MFIAIGLIVVFLLSVTHVYAAEPGQVTLTVRQVFKTNGSYPANGGTFNYLLIPKSASYPLPAGNESGSYSFTVAGTSEKQIGPITFNKAGVYTYELSCITNENTIYDYDRHVYTIEIHVFNDLTAVSIVYYNDSAKASEIYFSHILRAESTYPSIMVDPPVKKTVTGNPATKEIFTFKLAAENPSNPMPAGSLNGTKLITIKGSGEKDFGTWVYGKAGVYRYFVTEVNTGLDDYKYDTAVYTITDTVVLAGDHYELTRVITNEAGRQVDSYIFINKYTGKNTANNGGPNNGNNGNGGATDGPKTGDSTDIFMYITILCIAGITAIGSASYLLAGKRRRKERDEQEE